MFIKLATWTISVVLLCGASPGFAYESFGLSTDQQRCFSNAMVGMDSVINSRLGLPPEHALEITRVADYGVSNDVKFDNEVLNVMLNAYLWRTSPHSYAIKVFYDCAQSNSFQQQAKNEK